MYVNWLQVHLAAIWLHVSWQPCCRCISSAVLHDAVRRWCDDGVDAVLRDALACMLEQHLKKLNTIC